MHAQDDEAKRAARLAIVEGPLKDRYGKLISLLQAAGGQFLTGDKPTYAE